MRGSKTILNELKEAREVEGISQTELSRRIDIPQSHISKIERGAVDIQLSSLNQIARGLNYEVRLVPKNLLSSVDALIKSARQSRKDRTQQALKTISHAIENLYVLPIGAKVTQHNEIDDLKYNLKRLKELQYTQTDLDRLTRILSPKIIHPEGLIKFEDPSPESRKTLTEINNQLRKLRNNLVQKVDQELTRDIPIYSMVEDD